MLSDSYLILQGYEESQHRADAQLMFAEFLTGGLLSFLGLKRWEELAIRN